MAFKEELLFLEDILEVDSGSVSLEAPMDGLENWDSINILSFMALSDEKYNVSITADDLEKVKTVKDLLLLLKAGDSA